MGIAELIRLLENVVRTGTVTEIDEEKWRVRVQSGGLNPNWMRWTAQRAGAFKVWVPPSIGEQVWFLCLGGNSDIAIIGGSLYSDDNPAPGASRIESIFEERRATALTIWERYELRKSDLQEAGLSQKEYEIACRQLADSLGI